MSAMNVFRILADCSHTASKIILISAIHLNRSAEGVSLLTQWLYMLVFCTRYLDLLWVPPQWSWWNTFLKLFYISSSAWIIWVMMRVFARTREKEYAWKLATWSLGGSVVLAPVVVMVFEWNVLGIVEILWAFSEILESVCVLPQLLLLRQTTVPTVINSYYLVCLGSYRLFYIFNWIIRLVGPEHHFNAISVIFGVVQTALYVDFAWVYYTRQRVKLRGGGVVDSDDLSKSFLVSRIIGRGSRADREDEDAAEENGVLGGQENGVVRPPSGTRNWGARGISVSADDTLPERQGVHQQGSYADSAAADRDAQMIDPARFADEDGDGEDADAPPPPVAKDERFSNGHMGGEVNAWASNTGSGR